MNLTEKISPSHTALIVIDIQRDYFCKGGIIDLMGDDYEALGLILPSLERFIKRSRQYLKTVIFTKQTRYDYLTSPALVEHYTRARMIRQVDQTNEEFYQIAPRPGDIVLPKHRYSAFVGTPLDAILRSNGMRTLIVTGVATNVCVESTVRDGFMRDYHIVVPSDLTAGVSEQAKQMSLYNIATFFGHVLESEELLKTWERQACKDNISTRAKGS